jgi:predicted dehydrogenase
VAILLQDPRIQRVTVVEKEERKHPEIRSRYPNKVNVVSSFNEVEGGDILHVCTPNGYHFQHSLWGLEHGMHVLCEKPFTLTYEDSLQLIQKAKEKQRFLSCVLQNRFTPISQFLKQVVDNHILGDIYWIKVDCFWNRDQRYYANSEWRGTYSLDGGVLFTQFSHYIDIVSWLFGTLIYTGDGHFWNFNHEYLGNDWVDSGRFHFKVTRFPQAEGEFHFSTSCYRENLESSLTILGSKGTIKVGGQYMEKLIHCQLSENISIPQFQPIEQNDYGSYRGSANMHGSVIKAFIDRIFQSQWSYQEIEEVAEKVRFIEQVQKDARAKCKSYHPTPQIPN